MYAYCFYVAMSKSPKQLPNCRNKSHSYCLQWDPLSCLPLHSNMYNRFLPCPFYMNYLPATCLTVNIYNKNLSSPGADLGFQVTGGGAVKFFFWLFRVKNHDFTPKNHIFSNFWGGVRSPLDPPLQSMQVDCSNKTSKE
jgi:hypothetical protein